MTPVQRGGGERRILLVEDNPGDARLLRELLQEGADDAWEVERVKTARGARERLTNGGSPAAVLLDLGLPDSEGLETVRAVRDVAGPAPVVVLTGRDDPELGEDAVREGAEDYLIKGGSSPGSWSARSATRFSARGPTGRSGGVSGTSVPSSPISPT